MSRAMTRQAVRIATGPVEIEGVLEIPPAASAVILFTHGSRNSPSTPQSRPVAAVLREAGMATLEVDLLTPAEERDCRQRYNIRLLAQRLYAPAVWLRMHRETRSLPIGLFGAGTGVAAAIEVSAMPATRIGAVVSRGGRPDLAHRSALDRFCVPILLILGGLDDIVIERNEEAYSLLKCEKQLVIVPGATHLFEEPGKLETVALLALNWFGQHLVRPDAGVSGI